MRGRVWTLSIAIAIALSPASAQSVSIDIRPLVVRQPGGHAVTASVDVNCPAEAPTDGIQENRLEVRQEGAGTLVIAVGGTGNLVCDGTSHTYRITAHVEEPTHRFHRGPAVANMFVLICDETGATCLQGDVTEDVLIVRPR